jgi:hypothetical protein
MTPEMVARRIARPFPIQDNTIQEKYGRTFMPRVRFETAIFIREIQHSARTETGLIFPFPSVKATSENQGGVARRCTSKLV